jgi:hypothetical protein
VCSQAGRADRRVRSLVSWRGKPHSWAVVRLNLSILPFV